MGMFGAFCWLRYYTATNEVYRLQTAVSRAEGVCVVLFVYFELRHCKVYVRPVRYRRA